MTFSSKCRTSLNETRKGANSAHADLIASRYGFSNSGGNNAMVEREMRFRRLAIERADPAAQEVFSLPGRITNRFWWRDNEQVFVQAQGVLEQCGLIRRVDPFDLHGFLSL